MDFNIPLSDLMRKQLFAGRAVPDLYRLGRSFADARRWPSGLNATLMTCPRYCRLRRELLFASRDVPDLYRLSRTPKPAAGRPG